MPRLPAVTRQRALPTAIFAPQAGQNYRDVALFWWLEARLLTYQLTDNAAVIDALRVRLENGARWFATHAPEDPDCQIARELRSELEMQMDFLQRNIPYIARTLWRGCCCVYAALTHVEDARDYALKEMGFDAHASPQRVWERLCGDVPPPDVFPPREDWRVVERQIEKTPLWQIEELVQAVKERQP